MKATVILPTFDHGSMIQFAIESLLRQTHQDFELFVIGDGAIAETDLLMEKYQKQDSRIKYYKHPKDSRLGEIYRHPLLMNQATGDFVCYLADDDFYLENHLSVMAEALQHFDFVNSLPVKIQPDGSYFVWQLDLSLDYYRNLLLHGENRTPLSMVAHTMDLYRRLPFGWRTTPQGIPTDLYMWQQILAVEPLKASSLFVPTSIHLASSDRKEVDRQLRFEEVKNYYNKIINPQELDLIIQKINQAHLRAGIDCELKLEQKFLRREALQVKEHQCNLAESQLRAKKAEQELAQLHIELASLSSSLQDTQVELRATRNSRAYRWAVRLREAIKGLPVIKKILKPRIL